MMNFFIILSSQEWNLDSMKVWDQKGQVVYSKQDYKKKKKVYSKQENICQVVK